MSVAAPEVTARTEVATGGLSVAAPPPLLPSAKGPSEHASARTSAPRRVAARRGLVWDIISILTLTRRGRPPRANARSGSRLVSRGRRLGQARAAQRVRTPGRAVKKLPPKGAAFGFFTSGRVGGRARSEVAGRVFAGRPQGSPS